MTNNKFQLKDGTVLLDLTSDTVTSEKLAKGETAHDASGAQITGTAESTQSFSFDSSGRFMYPPKVTVTSNITSLQTTERGFRGHTEIEEVDLEPATNLTSIAQYAFYQCTGLKKVILPSSVSYIGQEAFYGCNKLANIVFPEGLKSIGLRSFSGCTALKNIILPSSLTYIETVAFGSSGLTSIVIPATLTTVGGFSDCHSLASITISEGVKVIENSAFSYTIPQEIILPSTLTSIGRSFNNITTLTRVVLKSCPNAGASAGYDGWWNDSANHPFYGCYNITDFVIPQGWSKNLYMPSSELTHDSLVNLIANLADFSSGDEHQLRIGTANLAKLSEAEIAVATAKNWTVT